jgi:sterol desaturase/sphingolipid hydroxylase (fatty acid hydroxylase superfamily)
VTGGVIAGALGAILWLERRRRLREPREDKLRRDTRNLAMGALTTAAIRLTEKPLTDPLAKKVHERRWGLLPRLGLPPALEVGLAAVLLDYTLYVWHVLTHRVPFLWRFHRIHHADRDLSATTALRFHFVEMILSVPWRVAQIALIGAAPRTLSLWQTLTLAAILFHHSNLRLPIAAERRLARIVVTPRMHGIHHSIVEHETNSNWGTIFSLPDYLHDTIRLNVPQARIDIGVPAVRMPEELRLPRLLRMPFEKQRPTWLLYGKGPKPERKLPVPDERRRLAE